MLTEVMVYYGLTRPPVDVGFFKTEHHAQIAQDLQAAIKAGRLVALTAVIGSGKTLLAKRLRDELEDGGKIIVSRSLTVEKAKITVPLLLSALFYDLSPDKNVKISSQSERRERDLQELFRRAKKPVVLFIDDAQDLHGKTLTALKRLMELVSDGDGQLSVVLVGKSKLKNDLKRPTMEEIGDRTTVLEFGGLRDQQLEYIIWALRQCLPDGGDIADVIDDEAIAILATKLRTPLQIGRYLVRAFEAGFAAGVKPVDRAIVDGVLSARIDEIEAELTRHGYDSKAIADQFGAKVAEVHQLFRGTLDEGRSRELVDEMRAAGLPV
jgi:type II secretory pathway predicted ATPase ExeA